MVNLLFARLCTANLFVRYLPLGHLDTFHAVIVAASPQTNDENGLLSSAMRKLDFETET